MGENKQNNKEKTKCDGDFCSATTFRLWNFMCFIPLFPFLSVKQGETERKRKIEGSYVLAMKVQKALYKRCMASY